MNNPQITTHHMLQYFKLQKYKTRPYQGAFTNKKLLTSYEQPCLYPSNIVLRLGQSSRMILSVFLPMPEQNADWLSPG